MVETKKESFMPFNVWLLFLVQALAMSAAPTIVFAGGLIGAKMAGTGLATLPIATQIIGVALSVYPSARLSQRFGRKKVFIAAMLLGIGASLLAAFAIWINSFLLFVVSTFLLGSVLAVVQQFRFAAMESVSTDLQPQAVSRLLLAGIVAAFIGPEVVTIGNQWLASEFVGGFILIASFYLLAAILLIALKPIAQPAQSEHGQVPRTLSQLLSQPILLIAIASAAVAFAVMSFVMTATPISMHNLQGFSLEHTKWVIQSHILAMFVPSLFSGWLIKTLGFARMIMLGIVIYLVCLVIGWWDQSLLHYWAALLLLGVGWNLLFVAGTALLPRSYLPGEQYRVQGLNDLLVFSSQGLASLSAGVVLLLLGWHWLLFISLLMILPLLYFLAKSYQQLD